MKKANLLEYSALDRSNTVLWNARILCFGIQFREVLTGALEVKYLPSTMFISLRFESENAGNMDSNLMDPLRCHKPGIDRSLKFVHIENARNQHEQQRSQNINRMRD
jgi:hypothetical protein